MIYSRVIDGETYYCQKHLDLVGDECWFNGFTLGVFVGCQIIILAWIIHAT
jgi:hypothetical protein